MYIILGQTKYSGTILSWAQFNKVTLEAQQNGNIIEYLGADMDPKGEIYCAFRELIVDGGFGPNKLYSEGGLYFVNNDVVFDFQKTKKPIKRRDFQPKEGLSDDVSDITNTLSATS